MRAASIFAGAMLAIVVGNAAHAGAASTHCAAGERVVYNCAFGRKVASICLAASTVSYRYGPLGAPELQIASTGADGRAFQNRRMASGGTTETSVRFVNKGYSYVIYVEARGAVADHPNENSSGIVVLKSRDDEGTTLMCRRTSRSYLNLELPSFVPMETRDGDFDHYY
jgi:hypothetical protein